MNRRSFLSALGLAPVAATMPAVAAPAIVRETSKWSTAHRPAFDARTVTVYGEKSNYGLTVTLRTIRELPSIVKWNNEIYQTRLVSQVWTPDIRPEWTYRLYPEAFFDWS